MAKDHSFSLDKWLDGLNLSAAERKTVADAITADDGRVAYIRDSQLAQSDYAFHMNALQEKIKEEERYLSELETWRGEQGTTVQQAQADLAKARGEAATYAEYLRSQGVDPATLGLSATPATATATTDTAKQPEIDTSKYVTRDQALALARWPVVYDQLNREHQRLFGQPIDGAKLFDEVMKSTDAPEAVFNRVFNVEARKAELATQERTDWEKRTRDEIRTQVQSEIAAGRFVPTNPINGAAPVIQQFGVQGKTNGDNWQQEAMSDFQSRQAARGA